MQKLFSLLGKIKRSLKAKTIKFKLIILVKTISAPQYISYIKIKI